MREVLFHYSCLIERHESILNNMNGVISNYPNEGQRYAMLPTEFSWMKSHPLKLIKYLKDLLVALKNEIIIKVFPIFFFI